MKQGTNLKRGHNTLVGRFRNLQGCDGVEPSPQAGYNDNLNPIQHFSTSCEALQAISLLTKYTDHVNDPLAHKLEGLLGTLSCQISLEQSKAMKDTLMTDYFCHL
ncbi:hypothetical protein BJV74DRAFT_780309 [Russula compacta]|nr:hypothetical protein BJV74DRAFT_780309 [Russula compacta]